MLSLTNIIYILINRKIYL